MANLQGLLKNMKYLSALKYVFDEKAIDLKVDIDKLYDKDFDGIPGSDIVDLAINLLKETHEDHSVKATLVQLRAIQEERDIYEPIVEFLLKYSDRGPEIYMAMEQGNILPKKQWEIDLIARENYILGGNETNDKVRNEMLSALAKTETPIELSQLSTLIDRDTKDEVEHQLMDALTERYQSLKEKGMSVEDVEKVLRQEAENTHFVLKENKDGTFALHGSGLLSGVVEVNEHTVQLFKLAHMMEKAMQSHLDSGLVTETSSLSQKQNELTLKAFIRIAQKYQGDEREMERELHYDRDDGKGPGSSGLLYNYNYIDKNNEKIEKNKLPDLDLGGTIYEPGPIKKQPDILYHEEKHDIELQGKKKYESYIEKPKGPYIPEVIGPNIENIIVPEMDEFEKILKDEATPKIPVEMPTPKHELDDGEIYL